MRHIRPWVLCAVLVSPLLSCAQAYFQQQVDYRISVQLNDATSELFAKEEFDYTNNSPRALDTLWIHLWPNAYRDRNTALCRQKDSQGHFDLHFAAPEERGYIDSLDFSSGGQKLAWGLEPDNPDITWLILPYAIGTGETITIKTPFHVKIPSAQFSRLGHTGQAFYITQWYPKPAVYNNSGWHAMPFLDQGEFYSEFGSFDVSITLPANYVVGATGQLTDNPVEQAWMDSLAALPANSLLSNPSDAFPPSSKRMKTLRFTQDHVHDFAWFADKRYHVRKGAVTLPRSGRTVTTWTLYTPGNAALWADAITYMNESVRLYSQWVGDYRYASCTAVDGPIAAGGGMEYPMITIIGNADSRFELDDVIAHEVGHNWLYGMLASNERDHPWMDEGMNSFFEQRYIETRYPGRREKEPEGIPIGFLTNGQGISQRKQNELLYRYNARKNWDSPTGSTSAAFTEFDYDASVYAKTALVFDQLFHDLGPARFDSCTQAYFNEWAWKHPQPADVQASYEKASGKDLNWCFGELIQTADKPDVKARKLKNDELTYRSTAVEGFSFPVIAWNGADSLGTTWIDGKHGRNTVALPWPNADRVRIDATDHTLDIDRRNNEVSSNGLLKRSKLPAFKFLGGLEREDRRSIYWSPAIGYNTHDGVMAGLALYNTVYPSQRFEWALLPMYGFQSNKLAGGYRFEWHNDRNRLLNSPRTEGIYRNLSVGISGFGASLPSDNGIERSYFRQVRSVSVDPRLRPTGPELHVGVRSIDISEYDKGNITEGGQAMSMDTTITDIYAEASIGLMQKQGFNPYDIKVAYLMSDVFSRISLTAKWSAIYDEQKHRVTFRAFTGTFFNKNTELMRPEMGWRMYWGSSDLLYDHLYTNRQNVGENTALQTNIDQGGFRTPTSVGTSDTWIAAMNMEVDFPFTLPLTAFASYGATPVTTVTQEGTSKGWSGNWEMGIGMRFWRDIAEVWVPLAFSSDVRKEQDLRGFNFTDRIRIVLALEKLDPTQALRKLPH